MDDDPLDRSVVAVLVSDNLHQDAGRLPLPSNIGAAPDVVVPLKPSGRLADAVSGRGDVGEKGLGQVVGDEPAGLVDSTLLVGQPGRDLLTFAVFDLGDLLGGEPVGEITPGGGGVGSGGRHDGTGLSCFALALTHLTAVSGANVTIVCGAVFLCAGLIGPRTAVVLAGVALAVFVVVVQPSASVLRAAVMGSIALLAVLTNRRHQTIPALATTILVVLLWAPQMAVDVGFALSVAATAALVLAAPVWSGKLVARGWPKMLADAVCVALAAQLVTAPLIAAISGRLSLVSVLANVVVAVVIPPITVLGTAAAALSELWSGAASLLIRFTGPELWWLLSVARTAAAVPGASVPVPSGWAGLACVGALTIAGVLLWPRRWFRKACAVLVLCVLAWSVSGLVSPA